MRPSSSASVAVATMTFVRDADEEQLLRAAMGALAAVGPPVVLADGGSNPHFVEFLSALPNVQVVPSAGRGLVAQVRASVAAAAEAGAEFVLYTEPDKRQFFERPLRTFLGHLRHAGDAGVIVAARSEESFATFPPLQRFTERTINHLCGEFLGTAGDYSYGPFLLHAPLVQHMHSIPDDCGWGWRHFMYAVAHRLSRRIVHVEDDLECPPDQRHEDEAERLHRVRQLGQNVTGLLLGLTTSLSSS